MGDLTTQTSSSPGAGQEDPKIASMTEAPGPNPSVTTKTIGSTGEDDGAAGVGATEGSVHPETQKQAQPELSGQHQPSFPSEFELSRATQTQPVQLPQQHGGPRPYNMSSMANALPPGQPQAHYGPGQYATSQQPQQQQRQQQQQRYNHPTSPPMMPQMPYGHPSAGMNMNMGMGMGHQGYYVQQQQQQPHMVQYYPGNQVPQTQMQMSSRQNMAYYPQQMMMNQPQAGFYYPAPAQYPSPSQSMSPTQVPRQHQHQHQMSSHQHQHQHQHQHHIQLQPQHTGSTSATMASQPHAQLPTRAKPRSKSAGGVRADLTERQPRAQEPLDKRSGAVRGPPRKPKQSGFAIWIGNLPPQADLMTLVTHVCKEAAGLESLFLISKSNCAFANYKDEESCAQAQQQIHDSQFQAVKLVSRLRKPNTGDNAAGTTSPTGPTSPAESNNPSSAPVTASQPSPHISASSRDATSQQDKFFILKSLTVEDLELSVTTGIWATQSHNEEMLNSAYQAAENVYLVFSANKSGEYFGYARMLSQIDQDPAAAIEFAPKAHTTSELDLPKVHMTEATDHVPKGRIIDDSARGTIFWEVYREESETGSDDESDAGSIKSGAAGVAGVEEEQDTKTWGKPFQLEWLSTTRLPFYRTRGLRNPWNSHREVKIARDGTELEPSVGRKLIGLFNRPPAQPQPFTTIGRPQPGMPPGFP